MHHSEKYEVSGSEVPGFMALSLRALTFPIYKTFYGMD
jgi:hypothetical protein